MRLSKPPAVFLPLFLSLMFIRWLHLIGVSLVFGAILCLVRYAQPAHPPLVRWVWLWEPWREFKARGAHSSGADWSLSPCSCPVVAPTPNRVFLSLFSLCLFLPFGSFGPLEPLAPLVCTSLASPEALALL